MTEGDEVRRAISWWANMTDGQWATLAAQTRGPIHDRATADMVSALGPRDDQT